jgi:RNA polymerase sigma factor (sigma-70 family)
LSELLAWLHGVLRHVVQEEWNARASARREELTVDGRMPDARDGAPSALESLIDDQLGGIVRECLAILQEPYRRVITLRYWEGLKYSEIAARLDQNENTVATQITRGTRALSRLVLERMHDLGRHDDGDRQVNAASVPRV